MKRINPGAVFYFLIILVTVSCASGQLQTEKISINNNILTVEIAETDADRQIGLMHRKTLDSDKGMLFVFESDRQLSFWMKNTNIPLSIAYISSDGTIREILDMTPHSLESIVSKNRVRFALEVNQGYFAKHNIVPGDKVELPQRYRR